MPKWWQGRSMCPKCRQPISWFDNIPLLSYIFLEGKCRKCQAKISWVYPAVELITAVTAAISPDLLVFFISATFIVIFFSDLIYGLIPDEMIAGGIVVSILRNLR